MKTIIVIFATLLISCTSALAVPTSTNTGTVAPRVTISERCQQLHLNCTQPEVLEVGRKLQQLYFSRYNSKPPQQRNVNVYTTADTDLIDEAIVNRLATINEKLRKDLELKNAEIGRLTKK